MTNTATATTSSTASRSALPSRRAATRAARLHRPLERERTRSATRSATGLWLREGRRRAHRARRRHGGGGRHARASLRRTARCGRPRRVERTTRCCASSATPRAAPRSAAASCCCRARCARRRARRYATPWVLRRCADRRAGRPRRRLARLAGEPCRRTPAARSRSCSTSGRRSTSTTTSTGSGRSPTSAARVGVERFVLDDGWFREPPRRHRRAGRLARRRGRVARRAAPAGRPRARARHGVRAVGRARDGQPRLRPVPGAPRLDPRRRRPATAAVAQPAGARPPARGAFAHVLGQLDDAAREHPIDYLKWDHNRDLARGRAAAGRPARRAPRRRSAFYALLDELRARHPGVEIGVCASGGGRVDLGILERAPPGLGLRHTDALARQQIQRWTGLLLPPELVGATSGRDLSHTTGRTSTSTSVPPPRCSAPSGSSGT